MARRKGLTFYQKKKKLNPKIIKDIFEMIVGGMIVIFLAFVIVFSVGMKTSVVGDSHGTYAVQWAGNFDEQSGVQTFFPQAGRCGRFFA